MLNIKKKGEIFVITMETKDRQVNVVTEGFVSTFESMVEEIIRDESIKGLVITSGRDEFMVGVDLDSLMRFKERQKCFDLIRRLQAVYRRLETWEKPVVAAINGTALDSGFELALSCNHRVALKNKGIKLGLSEVRLGLIPPCGGIGKYYYLLGLKKAINFLLKAKVFAPERALAEGLIDSLAEDEEDLITQAEAFITSNEKVRQPWDEKHLIPKAEDYHLLVTASNDFQARYDFPHYEAPMALLTCLHNTLCVGVNPACDLTARHFTNLVFSPSSRAIIRTLFYGIRHCRKEEGRPQKVGTSKIKKVGILGAGTMGSGIALASVQAGVDVVLKDIDEEVLGGVKEYIENLAGNARIETTTDTGVLAGCDLVIEAVSEKRKVKEQVLKETSKVIGAKTIFASNTSTLPIVSMAEKAKQPESFIGLHFFSPVDRMPLVEIIPWEKSSDKALALCFDFIALLKKIPIISGDKRGFFTTRVFMAFISEGLYALKEGIPPVLIERAGRLAGMPMGPLEVMDEVSIGLIYDIFSQAREDLGEDGIGKEPWEIISIMAKEGCLGKKSGEGFYNYKGKTKASKVLNPKLKDLFPTISVDATSCIEELSLRFLTIQSLETLRCLEEKVVQSAVEADVGSILGWGFPAYTGGALSYIDMIGPKVFVQNCNSLSSSYGKRFSPSKMAKAMSVRGETGFYDGI